MITGVEKRPSLYDGEHPSYKDAEKTMNLSRVRPLPDSYKHLLLSIGIVRVKVFLNLQLKAHSA